MLPMCVLTILSKLAMSAGFLVQLALNSFVVAVRELKVKLLLQVDFLDVGLGQWIIFVS